jgi:hypothetical protein
MGSSGVTIGWTTNEASDTQVEYGTTAAYGSSTTLNTSLVTSHSVGLSGLAASTTYHYRVKSRDVAGNMQTSGDFTFATFSIAPTKFYVVDDGASNQTYQYDASGKYVGLYSLNGNDSSPRGAASSASGGKLWVLDADHRVYVYDTSGALVGAWTAGSLPSNASVQGITTNGTDVWIVDARSDRVFKYTGAATRVSGSQAAAGSFPLTNANSNPKGIVTDGKSLWIVNAASVDKVFKYNVSGVLIGSWSIDVADASPTGITIDPNNVQHIWIVDNSADTVFQYSNAASRISGSQNADAMFALASGNTDPQDIADPPPLANASSAIVPKRIDGPNDLSLTEASLSQPASGHEPFGSMGNKLLSDANRRPHHYASGHTTPEGSLTHDGNEPEDSYRGTGVSRSPLDPYAVDEHFALIAKRQITKRPLEHHAVSRNGSY